MSTVDSILRGFLFLNPPDDLISKFEVLLVPLRARLSACLVLK